MEILVCRVAVMDDEWHIFEGEWRREALRRGFRQELVVELDDDVVMAYAKGGPERPTIYLSAGMHGDEPAGPRALLSLLRGDFFDDRFHWLICPVLNPSGLGLKTRENAGGVDLNRDYRCGVSREVDGHISWLRRQKVPQLFLSLHEDWESDGFYFYEINVRGEGTFYEEILGAAEPYFRPEPERVIDGHEVTELGWIYHSEHPDLPEGWPEAIFLAKLGCPLSLTFETPSAAPLGLRVQCHEAVVREAVARWERQLR